MRALEVGYRPVMLNSLLLASFLGDLPSEVLRVVSAAGIVRVAWARCVRVMKDDRNGPVWDRRARNSAASCTIFSRFHNVRFSAYGNELKDLNGRLKKPTIDMALRDQLKAGGGGTRETKNKKAQKPPKVFTLKQRDRAGSSAN